MQRYFLSDFVEIQRKSFFELLEKGLIDEFQRNNPIRNTKKTLEIFFYPEYYKLTLPEYNPRQAILKSKSYTSKLYIPVQLTDKINKTISLKWIYIGNLPLMTKRGHFILNGAPRVIINQILRSPGLYYQEKLYEQFRTKWDYKPEMSYKRYYADFICQRGTWLRLEMDKDKYLWAQMKKGPKIPLFWFLIGMGLTEKVIFTTILQPGKLLANIENIDHEGKNKKSYSYVKNPPQAWAEIYSLVSPNVSIVNSIKKNLFKGSSSPNPLAPKELPHSSLKGKGDGVFEKKGQKPQPSFFPFPYGDRKAGVAFREGTKLLRYRMGIGLHSNKGDSNRGPNGLSKAVKGHLPRGNGGAFLKKKKNLLSKMAIPINELNNSKQETVKKIKKYTRKYFKDFILPSSLKAAKWGTSSSQESEPLRGKGKGQKGGRKTPYMRKVKMSLFSNVLFYNKTNKKNFSLFSISTSVRHIKNKKTNYYIKNKKTLQQFNPVHLFPKAISSHLAPSFDSPNIPGPFSYGDRKNSQRLQPLAPPNNSQTYVTQNRSLVSHPHRGREDVESKKKSKGKRRNQEAATKPLQNKNKGIGQTTSFLQNNIQLQELGRKWIFNKFMNKKNYDLGKLGRFNLNRKLGIFVSDKNYTLTPQDLLYATDYLIKVENGMKKIDDIDHLRNRRVRTSGELIQIQIGVGLMRLDKEIRDKLNKASENYSLNMSPPVSRFEVPKRLSPKYPYRTLRVDRPHPTSGGKSSPKPLTEIGLPSKSGWTNKKIFNISKSSLKINQFLVSKSFNSALREFFGSSPLSQFMDQINPLAELTHKRRLSSMGPGGVTRDSATMAIRGIHPTHYGRICPVETPEGKNTGLVSSMTAYSIVNSNGFLYSPFYKLYKGQVQRQNGLIYFSADEEEKLSVAAADINISPSGFLPNSNVPVRIGETFTKIPRLNVDYIALSPIQMLSIATSLIPFLEHDDANRVLMGSNMQRQAVPLIRPERPIVGTGLEAKAISDSGHVIQTKKSGFIRYVSGNKIIVYSF